MSAKESRPGWEIRAANETHLGDTQLYSATDRCFGINAHRSPPAGVDLARAQQAATEARQPTKVLRILAAGRGGHRD